MVTLNNNADIKTARNLLITEVVLIAAFVGLTFVIDNLLYMVCGIITVSILANLFWGIRLLIRKPQYYKLYAALLQLPLLIIIVLFLIILSALSGVTC
ncbi:hypothetical protein ACLI09_14040 [Flavobacterium sp. RHBU_24]|uniref:hypothetical protein n=1 Tax=Flavobacterium sp. RHBU_24 TaxID=3391185 RepID=UPI00398558EF